MPRRRVAPGTAMSEDETPDSGATTSQAGAATEGEASHAGGSLPWLFLFGLLLFVASLVAFVADLATGHDVVRSLVSNAVGAVVLVAWAGLDSYRDPDSGVTTLGGAVGTGLILVGLYLLAAGLVVALTSVVHDRLVVGLAMAAGGLPLVLGGFVAYPIDPLTSADEQGEMGDGSATGTTAEDSGDDGSSTGTRAEPDDEGAP